MRNRKLVEMRLVHVDRAMAEGKAKVTVSDLGKLIRLEEFLREERVAGEATKIILEWRDAGNPSEEQDEETGGPESEGQ